MKRLALTIFLEIRLAYSAHQLRSICQGFRPAPYKRFQSIALLYGEHRVFTVDLRLPRDVIERDGI